MVFVYADIHFVAAAFHQISDIVAECSVSAFMAFTGFFSVYVQVCFGI